MAAWCWQVGGLSIAHTSPPQPRRQVKGEPGLLSTLRQQRDQDSPQDTQQAIPQRRVMWAISVGWGVWVGAAAGRLIPPQCVALAALAPDPSLGPLLSAL